MRNRRILNWLLAALAVLALCWSGWWFYVLRPERQLRENAAEIQRAVEQYAVSTQGSYPTNIEALIQKGCLPDWLDNPFGPGKMQPLTPDDDSVPGGFLYVTAGPVVAFNTDAPLKPSGDGWYETPDADLIHWLPPIEVDQYALVFYGARRTQRYRTVAQQPDADSPPPADSGMEQQDYPSLINRAAKVDWSRVALVLTAGED